MWLRALRKPEQRPKVLRDRIVLCRLSNMICSIRSLKAEDESFLWEMLYQALYVPDGHALPPREIICRPELACYVSGWGREGDCGFLASETENSQSVGAVWLRRFVGEDKGYGYINDHTPELSIAVLPEYRGQGIGTRLLTRLFASDCGKQPVSLSVSVNNPALRLYERFGFEPVGENTGALIMKRKF